MAKKKKKKGSSGIGAGMLKNLQGVVLFVAKGLPLFVVAGIGFCAFSGIRQALYADSGLVVQRILVTPAQAISVIQRERLESQFLGKNILQVDLNQIEGVLEKDPAILAAAVKRKLPTEIHIEITKRNPIAFMRFGNSGKYSVISSDGMILDSVDEKQATGLIIEAPALGSGLLSIGQVFKNRAFQESVKFLELYQQLPLSRLEPVTKVILDHLGNVSVYLKGAPEVRLGRRPSQRLEAFKKIGPLLESEMRLKIDYLDLQFDDVVVKQKRGAK